MLSLQVARERARQPKSGSIDKSPNAAIRDYSSSINRPRGTNSMTSPSQYRHIPLHRLVRDSLKRSYFAFYKLGVRLGVHILPVRYYATVPNIIELERTVDLWAKPSAMSGVDIDLDEQIDNL